jgi:outer membrane protein assembly factor BamB
MTRFHRKQAPALAMVTTLLATSICCAQEWTQFRGPNASGISSATTIPANVTEADFNWKVKLPGIGHSSPVIWGDRIFVTAAEEETGKRHFLCINANDGKTVWTKTFPFNVYRHHQFNNAASTTPAVDSERVYVAWPSPQSIQLYAFDHSGKELWKRDLGGLEVNHGGGCSPVVVDGVVVYRSESEGEGAPESFVIGLDAKTGQPLWKTPRTCKSTSYSTPVVYRPKSGPAELILNSEAHGFMSLDPKTGAINWESGPLFKQRTVSSPVLMGDLIFGTSGNGGGARQGVAIQPGSKASGTAPQVKWEVTRGVGYVPTGIYYNRLLYVFEDANFVACMRPDTGETIWRERVGGNFFGSPVCVNGKLYAMNSQGELVVVEAAEQFKLCCKVPLGEASHSTPAVSDGVMYLRTEGHLISLGGKQR